MPVFWWVIYYELNITHIEYWFYSARRSSAKISLHKNNGNTKILVHLFILCNNTYLRKLWKCILIIIIYRKQVTYCKLTVLNEQSIFWLLVIWVIRDVRVLHDIKCKQLCAGEFPYVYLVTQKSRHIRVQSASCNG